VKNAGLYLLVGALTAGNLGFRLVNDTPEQNVLKTTRLEVGDRVISPSLPGIIQAGDEEATCSLVIAFSPDCPHCRAAAVAERASERTGSYAQSTWIAEVESERMGAFADVMSSTSALEISGEVFASLEVTAVPAAFLIDDDNVIRWRGPYTGSESGQELAARCESTPTPSRELIAAAPTTSVTSSD
jgi:hypothetical protein